MLRTMSKNWWVFILRGILAIMFGLLTIIWPELSLIGLVWAFAAFVFLDGLFQVFSVITRQEDFERWWLILAEGLLGIGFGVLAFFWPEITILALLAMVVAWALLSGVIEIAAAIQLRKTIANEWLLGLTGVLSILAGILMILWPAASAVALAFIIGVYAILFGITMIVLGTRLNRLNREGHQIPTMI